MCKYLNIRWYGIFIYMKKTGHCRARDYQTCMVLLGKRAPLFVDRTIESKQSSGFRLNIVMSYIFTLSAWSLLREIKLSFVVVRIYDL